jgi:radical SAM enzyme (rSAM/lipoprotein system)
MALNVFAKYAKTQAQIHDLNYFFWECTLRCNINCLHCGSDCKKDNVIKDMPADDFLKVTARIKEQYNPNKVMAVITGGEPLMRNDLEHVGRELFKQGYPWGFVTNGILLTEQRFSRLMDSGLRSITVSLDGFKDNHNWLRGNSAAFDKAEQAIKRIVANKDIIYDVVTCVSQRNFHELPGLKKYLIDLGVKNWRLFTIDPIGRAKQIPELFINSKQLHELMDFMKATREEGIIMASYGCEGFLGKYENEVRDGFFFCNAGINVASVLCDGSISVCPNNSRFFIQGNIYKDDFLDVWNNRFLNLRNRDWTKISVCRDCKVYKWCNGNGMHLHNNDTDGVMMCHYNMLMENC